MSESIEDQVSRLRAMSMCSPVSGTDLDEDGIAAIRMAVRVLSVIQFADDNGHMIETYDVDTDEGAKPYMLTVGSTASTNRETYGDTLLECFSEAGKVLQ